MRAVHVGVGHHDDLAVPPLAGVLLVADPVADGGDDVADLLVAQDPVEPGPFDVEDLAPEGEDRLVEPVAPAFGGAAGGVALDEEQLAGILVVGGAVHQLAGQAAAGEDPFAVPDEVAGLAGGLAGLGGELGLGDHLLGRLRVLLQEVAELLGDDLADDPLDLGVAELGLGLPLELGVGHPDADDRGQAFLEVLAGDRQVLPLARGVGLGVVVHRPGQGTPEAGQVRPALDGPDVVAVRHQRLADGVVVLQSDLDFNRPLLVFAGKHHRGVQGGLRPVEVGDELGEAAGGEELLTLRLVAPLVRQA